MKKHVIRFDNTEVAFASKSNRDLKRSYFIFSTMQHPFIVSIGVRLTTWALKIGLPIKGIIKKTLFYQFCGGESISDSTKTVNQLADFNIKTILDYSVEGGSNEMSFDSTCKQIVEVCNSSKDNPNIPFCVVKLSGLGSVDLMTRAQAGEHLTEIEKNKLGYIHERAEEIAKAAKSNGLLFMIDAEETWMQDVVDEITYALMAKYNKDYPLVYNTYQFYCKDALPKLKRDADTAEKVGYYFGAKLVRGAYIEQERERANEMGYDDPIQEDKSSCDNDYDEGLKFCIENIGRVGLCAGTHNENSSAYLVDLIEEHDIMKDDPHVYFAQLLGMSDHISFNLSNAGYNVAKYVPYGPVEKVMPYLFRRAEENTSIAGQSGREISLVKKEMSRRNKKRSVTNNINA